MSGPLFLESEWLIIFPAVTIGVCIGSLIALVIERGVIDWRLWVSFILRDLLWIGVALRRLNILNQSDVIIILQEFLITCLFVFSTYMTYRISREKNVLRQSKLKEADDLEDAYHGVAALRRQSEI